MYKKALEFIVKKHGSQKRHNGDLFIIHPIRVSQSVIGNKQKIIALLHDVIEDTDATFDELKVFGEEIVDAVKVLTIDKGDSYLDYINGIKTNPDAVAVKIADIADNLADNPSENAIKKSVLALDRLVNN